MAQIPVIAATTAQVLYSATTAPMAVKVHSAPYKWVVASADNLAGAEEVDIYGVSGSTAKEAKDVTGTVQKLTATVTWLKLEAGPTYLFSKDATVGACGVYVDFGPPAQ